MTPHQQEDEMLSPAKPQAGAPAQPDPKGMGTIYRKLGIAAMDIIYDQKASAGIVQMLKTSGDPPHAVAQAAVGVLQRLKDQIKGVPPSTVYIIAPAVIVFICELGDAAGLFKASPQLVAQATVILEGQLQGQGAPAEEQQESEQQEPEQQPAPEQVEGAAGQGQGLIQQAMGG